MNLLLLAVGLIAIGIMLFIHELGHFAVARLFDVDVEVLSFGIGPKLIAYQGKRTEYRISLIPFGGYCRMQGSLDLTKALQDNARTLDKAEAGSYFSASPIKRFLIYLAGPLTNFILAVLLLSAASMIPVERLSDELISMNKERKSNTEEALSLVEEEASSSLKFFLNRFVLVENSVPRGLTGAIASRLLNEYGVPTLVLASTEDGRISASMRTKKNFNARSFLDRFSSLFQDYGGHSCAAGFSMEKENLDVFKSELNEAVFSLSEDEYRDEQMLVDAELPESYMSSEIWRLRELFEPYGQENENLKFHIRRATVEEVSPNRNGGTYLRCTIRYNSELWPAVFWDYDKSMGEVKSGSKIEFIFSPEINTYKGISRLQLNILSLEVLE